jgi:DNA replicative helicase MCM subunit Mcm2 (Cdc46/Mcm family)
MEITGINGVISELDKSTRFKVKIATFYCRHCGREYKVPQEDTMTKIKEPFMCACDRKTFEMVKEASDFTKFQIGKITVTSGLPKGFEEIEKLTFWLQGDLVDKPKIGENVEFEGVLVVDGHPRTIKSLYKQMVLNVEAFKNVG